MSSIHWGSFPVAARTPSSPSTYPCQVTLPLLPHQIRGQPTGGHPRMRFRRHEPQGHRAQDHVAHFRPRGDHQRAGGNLLPCMAPLALSTRGADAGACRRGRLRGQPAWTTTVRGSLLTPCGTRKTPCCASGFRPGLRALRSDG